MELLGRLIVILLAVYGFSPAAFPEDASYSVSISEWTVPWPDTRPRDPAVAADGSIWLVGQGGHYVAHFDPDTAEFFISAPVPSGAGTVRHMVYDEKRNSLWFGTDTNKLGQARLP